MNKATPIVGASPLWHTFSFKFFESMPWYCLTILIFLLISYSLQIEYSDTV